MCCCAREMARAAIDSVGERLTLGRDLTTRSGVGGGYANVSSLPAGGGVLVEHRVFEQYSWSGRVARETLSLRTRLEQRFIEANSGTDVRLRQQIRIGHALTSDGRLSLVAADEIMWHLDATSRSARGLDQNRLSGGLRRKLSRRVDLEAGYLNQYSRGQSGPAHRNHVVSLTMSVSTRG